MAHFDVVIVGAGPAGLSAALILGRCRRPTLVIDSGKQRNVSSRAMHGYLSRDGISPVEFFTQARQEIKHYECVSFRAANVLNITPDEKGEAFIIDLGAEEKIQARKIVLATGMADEIPAIPGFKEFFGKNVFLCPYCDAWEVKDKPIAIYGKNERGIDFSLLMTRWSRDLVVLSDGRLQVSPKDRALLEKYKVRVMEQRISHLEGKDKMERIIFKDGSTLERAALFFNTGKNQKSSLARKLDCRFTRHGGIRVDRLQYTGVKGVYAAGDACDGLKMVIVAAAQGATAGFAINNELLNAEIV